MQVGGLQLRHLQSGSARNHRVERPRLGKGGEWLGTWTKGACKAKGSGRLGLGFRAKGSIHTANHIYIYILTVVTSPTAEASEGRKKSEAAASRTLSMKRSKVRFIGNPKP